MADHPTLPVDLLSLEMGEEDRLDVRCRQCNGVIYFYPNRADPMESEYRCSSSAWYCGCVWVRRQLIREERGLHHWLYTSSPDPVDLHTMDLIENVGTTAFHRLRPATAAEVAAFSLKTLTSRRKRLAQTMGVKL